ELGEPPPILEGTLYPVYVRGQARLAAHNGTAAAAEFQKFLDHRGIVLNFPLGALARLNLARAYAVSGDTNKSRTAYQDFFAKKTTPTCLPSYPMYLGASHATARAVFGRGSRPIQGTRAVQL